MTHYYKTEPLRASEQVWERGGRQAAPNGAVMRCSASAFVHFNDLEKVIAFINENVFNLEQFLLVM